ncbi:MAG: hypothetical protein WCG87_07655 [Bacteroidota bacterium]
MKQFILIITLLCTSLFARGQGFINATQFEILNNHANANIKIIDYNDDESYMIKTSDDVAIGFFFINSKTGRCNYSILVPKETDVFGALLESAQDNFKVVINNKKWTNSNHGIDVKINTFYDNNFQSNIFVYEDVTPKDDE